MEYLKIRRSVTQRRADGSNFVVPLVVKKTKKYGKVLSEKAISKKHPIIVAGAHDSGKSRWLSRLHQEDRQIWSKHKSPSLWLDAIRPLSALPEDANVSSWWNKQGKHDPDHTPWAKLKAWERQETLATYVQEMNPVVFIDNAHKLTGRKLQIAKECLVSSKLFVIAVSDEQQLPPSIRHSVLNRSPQIFRLGTETAYDGTSVLIWLFALLALFAGWWEASLVLGRIGAMSKGNRAAKQN